jgi:AraC family transcriptional regulator, alkane utilization regulator
MTDRLAALLSHFTVRARAFHAGPLCGVNTLEAVDGCGQLHLIHGGTVAVQHRLPPLEITMPSVLFYPRPLTHRFVTDAQHGAEFLCAHVAFEGGEAHPIAAALPEVVCLPLDSLPSCAPVLGLLFAEAEGRHCGRQALLDRLFEVVLIQILRELMAQGHVKVGMMAGLSDERLRLAITAIHDEPQAAWSLERLAAQAGMSRTLFANRFRETVGCTPGYYLQRWRIGLAQKLLRQGRALKLVATEVGYGSEAALSRAFSSHMGMSPRAWRRAQKVAADE